MPPHIRIRDISAQENSDDHDRHPHCAKSSEDEQRPSKRRRTTGDDLEGLSRNHFPSTQRPMEAIRTPYKASLLSSCESGGEESDHDPFGVNAEQLKKKTKIVTGFTMSLEYPGGTTGVRLYVE